MTLASRTTTPLERFSSEVRAGGAAGAVVIVALAATLLPWVTPPVALALGLLLALTIGNPFSKRTSAWSKTLLKASVVGLGFGVPLAEVARAGATGVGYTIAGIALAIGLGLLLGRALKVERQTSWLITGGTAICGGSAIAALGPAIKAKGEAMSVALATVFVLNAVALYAFPPIGATIGLSQDQFAVWAAIGIHDTASVVGAAAQYGERALDVATVLKLARALWIAPLAIAAAWYVRREARRAGGAATDAKAESPIPWFIGFFVLAALAASIIPHPDLALVGDPFAFLALLAKKGLVVTLFLIGAGLTRKTLHAVGLRPLVQGVVLWVAMSALVLAAVVKLVPA